MFNILTPIEVPVLTPAGLRRVMVRFPSDEQCIARQRARKVVQKTLGRGQVETLPQSHEQLDADLYRQIRLDESADLDPFEASEVMARTLECEATDAAVAGDVIEVTLRTIAGVTTHTLRMPSAKDRAEYARGFIGIRDLSFGRQQITVNLQAPHSLYDRLAVGNTGYEGPVPVVHRSAVISAALQAIDDLVLGDGTVPN